MIDKSLFYKFIYVSVSFVENPVFVKGLCEKYGAEIPFLGLDTLNPALKESLDSYFYLEDNDEFVTKYKEICRGFPRVSFTVLGRIRGKDIFSFFTSCQVANVTTFKKGDYVKVVGGALKNLSATVLSIKGETAEIEFSVLNQNRVVSCPVSDLVLHDQIAGLELCSFRPLEERYFRKGIRNDIVVDGDSILFRAMSNIPNRYNSKHNYVGGFIGFYFAMLKLKEMYPEYRINVVFSPETCHLPNHKPRVHAAYESNHAWCRELVSFLGYPLYVSPTRSEDLIATLVASLKDSKRILIYSTNTSLHSLCGPRVETFCPKTTFRGNSIFVTEADAKRIHDVSDTKLIPAAIAFAGDPERGIPSITEVLTQIRGPRQNKIKSSEYNHFLVDPETLVRNSVFADFAPQLATNLAQTRLVAVPEFPLQETTPVQAAPILSLLEEIELYKEVELWDRSERIFKGMW